MQNTTVISIRVTAIKLEHVHLLKYRNFCAFTNHPIKRNTLT